MDKVAVLSDRFAKLSNNLIIEAAKKFEPNVPGIIRDRLYTSGTYTTDKPIVTYFANTPNVYAHRTIDIKGEKGQPTDRVTLKDTGQFYATIKATAGRDAYTVTGDTEKFEESVDPDNVLGLSETDINKIRPEMITLTIQTAREILNV